MNNQTNEFKTKIAIVTGGSRGIGKEICLQFAKQGSNIIFNYARHHKEAKETQDEILKYGVNCDVIKCFTTFKKHLFYIKLFVFIIYIYADNFSYVYTYIVYLKKNTLWAVIFSKITFESRLVDHVTSAAILNDN